MKETGAAGISIISYQPRIENYKTFAMYHLLKNGCWQWDETDAFKHPRYIGETPELIFEKLDPPGS